MGHQEIMGTPPKRPEVHPFQQKVDIVADHLRACGHRVEIIHRQVALWWSGDEVVTIADNLKRI